MKRLYIILAAVLIIALTASCCTAEGSPRLDIETEIAGLTNTEGSIFINEDPAYEKMISMLLYTVQKRNGFRGSVIVATDDDLIFASGTGLTDNDGNVVTSWTTYEIGSLTKSFTAVCVMKLTEEGKLSLNDPIGGFFPECAQYPGYEKTGAVTVGQLLHMRSGLPDYMNAPDRFFGMDLLNELAGRGLTLSLYDEKFVNSLLETVTDEETFLRYLFSCENTYAPDTKYEYSNTNYFLLAMIIEKVTGKTYEAYMNETVFGSCGMAGSSAMSDGTVTASVNEKGWHFLNAGTKGAGDIFSNTVDLLRYDRALFGGYLLGEDTMKELLTPVDAYACGWFADGDVKYHTGGTPAFSTMDYVIERNGKRLYIISLANLNENLGNAVFQYLDKYFDQ